MRFLSGAFFVVLISNALVAFDGASVVSFYGYNDCIELSNDAVTVRLCPAAGGRVLEYSCGGKNVLYLPPGGEGWTFDPEQRGKKAGRAPMNAGRFDIGPEKVVKRGPLLWMGKWAGEITGDRNAKLVSQVDPVSGVQLTRTFQLAADSSHLVCTQTIHNVSNVPVNLCHWSRTFAVGNGIAVIPRSPLGRFPNGYVMYTDGNNIGIRPEDPNIHVTESNVVIKAAPQFPKLGFDSHAQWLAYFAPTDQLFIKRFRTFRNRAYNEVAGLTISVWYPKDRPMVELEPIGPAERLQPGEKASFAEEWWILDHVFPADGNVDLNKLHATVKSETKPPL